jgi:hypothetical protein
VGMKKKKENREEIIERSQETRNKTKENRGKRKKQQVYC